MIVHSQYRQTHTQEKPAYHNTLNEAFRNINMAHVCFWLSQLKFVLCAFEERHGWNKHTQYLRSSEAGDQLVEVRLLAEVRPLLEARLPVEVRLPGEVHPLEEVRLLVEGHPRVEDPLLQRQPPALQRARLLLLLLHHSRLCCLHRTSISQNHSSWQRL